MRNSQAKKDENRQLILKAAGHLFRERGIDAVSVADVMNAASMTHGGFYRHFADKNELVTQALANVLDIGEGAGQTDIGMFADAYLTMEHRTDCADGCAFAALGSEVARGTASTRHVMTGSIRSQLDSFAQSLSSAGSEHERRQVAIGSWATMIGALLLARVSDDIALAEEILVGAHAWVASGQAGNSKVKLKKQPTRPSGHTN